MTTPIYNRTQIIYALNSISNTPSNEKGTVEELETYAKEVISQVFENKSAQALIGEWELVWGPCVYQTEGSNVADNAMYVARNKNRTTDIVVAISGTNPISKYGWIHEDFLINPMQDWPYASGLNPQPKISNGTKLGTNILFNDLKNESGQTLTDYLKQQVATNPISVTVTGHSLGGALSPAVALALKNMQGKTDGWDPKSSASIAVEPSAGPTSGNKDWADYYDAELGSATTRLWNAIDIVPHAWELDMLKAIPTLYEPEIPESVFINALTKLAEANSIKAGNMHQICDQVAGLPGKIETGALINIHNILEILEVMVANDLIELLAKKLNLKPLAVVLIKKVIDELIKYLNDKLESADTISMSDFKSIKLDSKLNLKNHSEEVSGMFISFLDFLIQAGYQHTTAYAILMKTTVFSDLVSVIEKGIKMPNSLEA